MAHLDLKFWGALLGGMVLAVMFSDRFTWLTVIINAASGVFIALIFHEPVLSWLGWDIETYKLGMVAFLAATGPDLARMILTAIRNPIEYIKLFIEMRKGKIK